MSIYKPAATSPSTPSDAVVFEGNFVVPSPEEVAYQKGWNDCMKMWADHMERMNRALATREETL